MSECIFCGNQSDKRDTRGNCIACGAPREPSWESMAPRIMLSGGELKYDHAAGVIYRDPQHVCIPNSLALGQPAPAVSEQYVTSEYYAGYHLTSWKI